jgi:two-component system, cell cycle response regulator DivK
MTAGLSVILAIEDEPRNAALLRAVLKPARFELHLVSTLGDGRAWLADHRPDLILLDRHLPDGDGLSLVRELRSGDGPCRGVPVLLVTASVLPSDREAAELAGCDGFVAKPIRIVAILDEIEQHLAAAASRSG